MRFFLPPGWLLLRITVAVWSLVYLALGARTLFFKVDVDKASVYGDFSSAGDHWLKSEKLYQRGGKHEFRYSPLVAALFVPFDLLPARVGEFLWQSLNFATFTAGLSYCCLAGVPRRFSIAQCCAIYLLCLPLAIGSLNNAQSNPLMLGLLLLAAAAVVQKRWSVCCIAITLATCFKLYPVVFGLLLVAMYPRKLGWRLTVCILCAALVPFVLQRAGYVMEQYNIWAHYLSSEDRQFEPITDWYRDLRALLRVYVIPIRQDTYRKIEVVTGALMALTCLLARLRRMPAGLLAGFTLSLACCWMTVLGPATESATYILLAPCIAWGIVLAETDSPTPDGAALNRFLEDTPRSSSASGMPKASTAVGASLSHTLSRLIRVGYWIVLGLFSAAQMALWFGNTGKLFRDRLQPLPLAGLMLMVLVWGDMIGANLSRLRTSDVHH